MIYFFVFVIAFVAGIECGLWLAVKPPLCTCDDPDCGGGCIDWNNANV